HPNDVRVRRCERDGADRRRRLVLEDRFPRIAPVDRLPYAARRRTEVLQVAISRNADHGGHTTTGHRGAEVSELEVVERIRTADRGHLRRLLLFHPAPTLRRSRRGERERQEQTAETGLTESHAAHRTSSSGGFLEGYENAAARVGPLRADLPAGSTRGKRVKFPRAHTLPPPRGLSRGCRGAATPRRPGSIRSAQVPADGHRQRRRPPRPGGRERQRAAARATAASGPVRPVFHAPRLGTGG